MLILGHTGLTLGAAVLLGSACAKSCFPRIGRKPGGQGSSKGRSPFELMSSPSQGDGDRGGEVLPLDMRLLLIGSLLPDIIDKPVGQLFFRDAISNGRIFCHTLLFLIVITIAGLYLYRSRRVNWLLVLSFGTFTHLIFDQMWLTPQTLLWPLYGFAFERHDLTHWAQNILHGLCTDPGVYLPELVGAAVLVWFALMLVRRRKVYAFITRGKAC